MRNLKLMLAMAAVFAFVLAPSAFAGDNKDDEKSGKTDKVGDGDSGQGNDEIKDATKKFDDLKRELKAKDMFAAGDKDGDGLLTKEEAEEAGLESDFGMDDTDGDGMLNLNEAKKARRLAKKAEKEGKEAKDDGKDRDVEDDSDPIDSMDEDDFAADPKDAPDQKPIKERFDENKDGTLDEAEIVKFKEFLKVQILAKMDKNSDGVIDETEKEMLRVWKQKQKAKKLAKEYDKDGDGQLSDDEKDLARAAAGKKNNEDKPGKGPKAGSDEKPVKEGGDEQAGEWKPNGQRGKWIKEWLKDKPELKEEFKALIKANPDWKDEIVDKDERARWVLEHSDEYPKLAEAIFRWHDAHPNAPGSEWLGAYSMKRIAVAAKNYGEFGEEFKGFVEAHPEWKKDVFSKESIDFIMANADKYPELKKYMFKYCKDHKDAAFQRWVAPHFAKDVIANNKEWLEENKDELRGTFEEGKFKDALAKRKDVIKAKLAEEGVTEDEIVAAMKKFDEVTLGEFKDRLKDVEKFKKEKDKLLKELGDDVKKTVGDLKKSRDEYEKKLNREYKEAADVNRKLEEFDKESAAKIQALKEEHKKKIPMDPEQKYNELKAKKDEQKKAAPADPNQKHSVSKGMKVSSEVPKDKEKDNEGVRDHGKGEGRDGAGEGKGEGKGPSGK